MLVFLINLISEGGGEKNFLKVEDELLVPQCLNRVLIGSFDSGVNP